MIRAILISACMLVTGAIWAQNSSINKSDDFISVAQEIKEPGKLFFIVDLSVLPDAQSKGAFMDKIYASDKVTAASTVKADNTVLISAYESVVSLQDCKELLENYKSTSLVDNVGNTTIDKVMDK